MKMAPFASLLGYDFPFAFHSNYGPILYHFGDKARYWSKITVFSCLHSTPPLGCPSDSCITFRVEKPEQCGYLIARKVTACGPLYDVVTGIGRSYLHLAHLEISISISEQINSFHFRISTRCTDWSIIKLVRQNNWLRRAGAYRAVINMLILLCANKHGWMDGWRPAVPRRVPTAEGMRMEAPLAAAPMG